MHTFILHSIFLQHTHIFMARLVPLFLASSSPSRPLASTLPSFLLVELFFLTAMSASPNRALRSSSCAFLRALASALSFLRCSSALRVFGSPLCATDFSILLMCCWTFFDLFLFFNPNVWSSISCVVVCECEYNKEWLLKRHDTTHHDTSLHSPVPFSFALPFWTAFPPPFSSLTAWRSCGSGRKWREERKGGDTGVVFVDAISCDAAMRSRETDDGQNCGKN